MTSDLTLLERVIRDLESVQDQLFSSGQGMRESDVQRLKDKASGISDALRIIRAHQQRYVTEQSHALLESLQDDGTNGA